MKILEPLLMLQNEHVVSGTDAWDVFELDLNLSYLEGIKIYRVELAPAYNVAPSEIAVVCGVGLDPNEHFADEDAFWASSRLIARVGFRGSATTQFFGHVPMVTDFKPDGFDAVRNLAFVTNSSVAAIHCAYKIFYKRVAYTEGDLVSVLALR